ISSEDAEWLKIRYGFADYRKEASSQKILIGERSARRIVLPGKLYEIIASKSDVLLYKTKRAFLELTSGIKDLNIKEMLVTGGGSVLEGFLERAEKVFDMPVKMGFLYGVNDSQIQARSALYSTGVGLICYGLGQKKGTRRYSRIRLKTFRNLLRKAHNLYYEYF
ncbi:MAG: hypothetical protein JW869_04385, partial [Candidatus Omnitrophica bacterium]|nr:hypothetical protein [Candidatus Omnitrophota bacterium]